MWQASLDQPAIERIILGQPAAPALAAEAARLGAQRVFLLVGGSLARETDEVDKLRAALGTRYAGCHVGMPAHTPRDVVVAAANAARDAGTDLLVTFGGGSITDAGKVMQLCLAHDITEMDGLEPFRMVTEPDGTRYIPDYAGPVVRQVAIPTTLSGGEYNSQAGCTDPRLQVKQSYRHPLFIPRVIIQDPAVTRHTPAWLWLSTGVRGVDHAVEAICSPQANPLGDAGALQALRLFAEALPAVAATPGDLGLRQSCQLAVYLSLAGLQTGVPMGASHAIGHILGGSCGVAHGHTSCVMLPHVLRWNRDAPGQAARQALVAAALGQPGAEAADAVAGLVRRLGQPGRLAEVGVTPADFPRIAAGTMRDPWVHTNPRRITGPAQVMEILAAAA